MRSPSRNRSHWKPYDFERPELLQAMISGRARLYTAADVISNIAEILFDGEFEIAQFSADTYKADGTVGIECEIQVTALLLFHTGAGRKLVSEYIASPS